MDWPAELLCDELRRLRANTQRPWSTWEVRNLLDQAFHTATPGRHFSDASYANRWLSALLDSEHLLRPSRTPAPYWRARRSGEAAADSDPRTELALVWDELYDRGYFRRETYEECPFDDWDAEPPPSLERC